MMDDGMQVPSDKFFNDSDRYDWANEMGIDVEPVDIYGGNVPTSKGEPLNKTQSSIRRRFSLGGDDE